MAYVLSECYSSMIKDYVSFEVKSQAKVYITGRRKEVLENAAKQHTPEDGGKIIP